MTGTKYLVDVVLHNEKDSIDEHSQKKDPTKFRFKKNPCDDDDKTNQMRNMNFNLTTILWHIHHEFPYSSYS